MLTGYAKVCNNEIMRKDTQGRPARIPNIKEQVQKLRDAKYSYAEIGQMIGVSRQLAQWHGKKLSTIEKLQRNAK